MDTKRVLDQTIDVTSQDTLLEALVSKEAVERCKIVTDSFENWIEKNKDEIIALQVLYERPKTNTPSFKQIKELHRKMKSDLSIQTPSMIWGAYSTLAEQKGYPKPSTGGQALADIVQLVRFAIDSEIDVLQPFANTVEERFDEWIKEKEKSGIIFEEEQYLWLRDIADHIGGSLDFQTEDFSYPPFSTKGGLGKAHFLFGEKLAVVISELNEVLV